MTKAEQRRIALGAVRSTCRARGTNPAEVTGQSAYAILDEIYRTDPGTVAAAWYAAANAHQYKLFCKEWQRQ